MNPLEPIIDQIADILKKTEEELKNPSSKQISESVFKEVERLEKLVQAYVRVHQVLLKESGLDEKKIKQIIAHVPENTPKKDRLVLERLTKLQRDVVEAKTLFERETKRRGGAALTDQERKQKEGAKRKKKFRGIGERDSWKKL